MKVGGTPSHQPRFCSVRFRRDSLEALDSLYDLGFGCVADQVDRLLFLVHDGADVVSARADEAPHCLHLRYRRPVSGRKV